jgi:hypothetical protein
VAIVNSRIVDYARATLALTVLGSMVLTGCAVSGSINVYRTWSKAVMEQTARNHMAEQGLPEPSVQCPGDMMATFGTVMRCIVTVNAVRLPLTITVVPNRDGEAQFQYLLVSTPLSVDGPSAERLLRDQLGAQLGRRPDKVECPPDLPAEVGKTGRCMVTINGYRVGTTYTVSSAHNGNVNFTWRGDLTPTAITKEHVEDLASGKLASTSGRRPDKIECPGDLIVAEHQIRCALIDGPVRTGLTFTVLSVSSATPEHGSDTDYTVAVDPYPQGNR